MIPTRFDRLGLVREVMPLTLRAEQAGSTVTLNATGSPTVSGLKYRTRSTGWQTYTAGSTVTLTVAGDYVQFMNTAGTLSSSGSDYVSFGLTGSLAAFGECGSLINYASTCPDSCFRLLFKDCTALLSAPEISAETMGRWSCLGMFQGCAGLIRAPRILPALTLANYCYQQMFNGCSGLLSAPVLPATRVYYHSYQGMFLNCTALTATPELPAQTLDVSCYHNMFNGCTSLVDVSDLPVKTIYMDSYRGMFYSCTSLVNGPHIYATAPSATSLNSMFDGCKNLESLTVDFTSWNNVNSVNWMRGVAASGTFTCPSGLTIPSRDADGVPSGWMIVNQ